MPTGYDMARLQVEGPAGSRCHDLGSPAFSIINYWAGPRPSPSSSNRRLLDHLPTVSSSTFSQAAPLARRATWAALANPAAAGCPGGQSLRPQRRPRIGDFSVCRPQISAHPPRRTDGGLVPRESQFFPCVGLAAARYLPVRVVDALPPWGNDPPHPSWTWTRNGDP